MKAIYELSSKSLFLVDWYPLFHANGKHCALLSVRLAILSVCTLCPSSTWVVGAIISLIASIYLRSIFWIRFFGLLLTIVLSLAHFIQVIMHGALRMGL